MFKRVDFLETMPGPRRRLWALGFRYYPYDLYRDAFPLGPSAIGSGFPTAQGISTPRFYRRLPFGGH